MFKLNRIKKELEEISNDTKKAADRTEKEVKLRRHLAARLDRVQIDLDNLSRRAR